MAGQPCGLTASSSHGRKRHSGESRCAFHDAGDTSPVIGNPTHFPGVTQRNWELTCFFKTLTPNSPTCRVTYATPQGALLPAYVNEELARCCALRPLESVDYPNACEMKRLYVRKSYRRLGLGRQLAENVLDAARVAGYHHLLLDTLSDMESARVLYEDLGVEEVPPYYHNSIACAHYLKVSL